MAKAGENRLALFYLDLDGFKPVNYNLGHAAGDQLLKHVAVCLRRCLRDGDLLARLGRDEFVVMLRVAERVLQPVLIDGQDVRVGCSIGSALWRWTTPSWRACWSWPTRSCIAPSTPAATARSSRDLASKLKNQPTPLSTKSATLCRLANGYHTQPNRYEA